MREAKLKVGDICKGFDVEYILITFVELRDPISHYKYVELKTDKSGMCSIPWGNDFYKVLA